MRRVLFCLSAVAMASAPVLAQNGLSSSTYLGGTGTADRVTACEYQPDGTLVVAAQISTATPGGLTPILLNGSTTTTAGCILRMTADGSTVLSVTRLAADLWDMSLDSAGNIYIAAGKAGLFKLNPSASTILWSQTVERVHRVDAALDGTVAVSATAWPTTATFGTASSNPGWIRVYSPTGTQIGSFAGHARQPGTYKIYDICIHPTLQRVYETGFNQASGRQPRADRLHRVSGLLW